MNSYSKQSTLLTEENWTDIVSNLHQFPMRVSEITEVEKEISLSKVSFKYNVFGSEFYSNGKQDISLKSGEYLIASNQTRCDVKIKKSAMPDLGLCIDINPEYLFQAMDTSLNPNSIYASKKGSHYFCNDQLFIKYPSDKLFHSYLVGLFQTIKHELYDSIEELELDFVRHLTFHQIPFLLAYERVPVIKQSTRTDIFSKMMEAKDILHSSIYHQISVPHLAKLLCLSEYRFFHLFKSTFNVSPHKYLVQLKMDEALNLFQLKKYTWTEIAIKLQFADIQSFSKVFKRHFRMSPQEYSRVKKY